MTHPFAWQTAALLVLAVWSIYVTDRLLDARQYKTRHGETTLRHRFHGRHERAFSIGLAVALGLASLLLTQASTSLWKFGFLMLGVTAAYALAVHRRLVWISKELVCGMVFSAGVVGSLSLQPFPWWSAVLFGLLCSANCLVIACSEVEIDRAQDTVALPQRWKGARSLPTVGLPTLAAVSALSGGDLSLALGIASIALWGVHQCHRPREWKRVMADACLLTPLGLWLWI